MNIHNFIRNFMEITKNRNCFYMMYNMIPLYSLTPSILIGNVPFFNTPNKSFYRFIHPLTP